MSEYIIEIPDYESPCDPAVYAVSPGEEIVRCRDCMTFMEGATPHDEDCPHFCTMHGIDLPSPDGFCAWGERRAES